MPNIFDLQLNSLNQRVQPCRKAPHVALSTSKMATGQEIKSVFGL